MAVAGLYLLNATGQVRAANEKHLFNSSAGLIEHPSDASQPPHDSLFEKALAAQKQKEFDKALTLFQKAVKRTDLGKQPRAWLSGHFQICHTLNLQGRHDEAAALARQIVSDCDKVLGQDDPLTSEALSHLVFILIQHGKLDEAEPVAQHNVRLLEAKYGTDHFLVARAICRHGSILLSLGRSKEAEQELRRALNIAVNSASPTTDRIDLCYFITHLAYGLRKSQNTEEARELMDLAYSIVHQEEARLEQYPLATSILRRQAEFYRDQQELDRAEELGRQCLLTLARRSDVNRIRFFYFDRVAEVFRTTLLAKGMTDEEVEQTIESIQAKAMATARVVP